MDISQPRLIVALGLYRGASTWTYNVMSALVSGETTRSFFADDVGSIAAQLLNETTHAVIKSHRPDAGMRLLIKLGGLPVVLNVRDPLDCGVAHDAIRATVRRSERLCRPQRGCHSRNVAILRTASVALRARPARKRDGVESLKRST